MVKALASHLEASNGKEIGITAAHQNFDWTSANEVRRPATATVD